MKRSFLANPVHLGRLGHRTWTTRASNFGVEWDEPREISEIRAVFKDMSGGVTIFAEYWVSLSSQNPPGGGQGGWTLTDTPWNGSRRPISGHASVERVHGSSAVLAQAHCVR